MALECDNRVVAAMTWSLHSIPVNSIVGTNLSVSPSGIRSARIIIIRADLKVGPYNL